MKEEIKVGMILRNNDKRDQFGEVLSIVLEQQAYGFYVLQHITGEPHKYRTHERQVLRFWEVVA
tara:strand:+ start:138 stop:329 length:192 start_codon:yes stop_codon:yes gene_type:complete